MKVSRRRVCRNCLREADYFTMKDENDPGPYNKYCAPCGSLIRGEPGYEHLLWKRIGEQDVNFKMRSQLMYLDREVTRMKERIEELERRAAR